MRRQRSVFRNRSELLAYRFARGLGGRLSPRLEDTLGAGIGRVFHALGRRRRRILDFNLNLAYPDFSTSQRRVLGRAVARHFGRALLGSLRLQRSTPEDLLQRVDVEGLEYLEEVLHDGRGFFVLSAHLGAWEVAALRVGLEIPGGLAILHRPLDNDLLDTELEGFRALHGNRVLNKRGGARPMWAEIKRGGAVGILIDQRSNQAGAVDVPFFGHPARTHSVLAKIVRRSGAAVLPTWAFAEGRGRYRLRIEAPVPAKTTESEEELTARYTAVTEAAIRRRPEQWLWYHDRWRELRRSPVGKK